METFNKLDFIPNRCFWKYCGIKSFFKYLLLFTFGMTMLGLSSVYVHLQFYTRCSDNAGLEKIRQTCENYYNKEIVGSMCSKLCDENIFRFTQCAGNLNDKSVQILECDGCIKEGITSKVVLKSETTDFFKHAESLKVFHNNDSTDVKAQKTFNDIVSKVKTRYQIDISKQLNLLDYYLGNNYTKVIEDLNITNADTVVFRNVLALVFQKEFLGMKVFSGVSLIPKLYGTCGQTYFVEYTPPLSMFNYVLFQGKISEIIKINQRLPSWSERAQIALRVLSLIRKIENAYERPLRLCDSAPSNYGIRDSGDIVLPDLGSVYFQIPVLKPCTNDSQCGRLACTGVCDTKLGRCRREMTNTNLQVICRKIFLSAVETFGLLRNPPSEISDELHSLLDRCVRYEHGPRQPEDNYSDENMLKQFESLLQASLDMRGSLSGYFSFSWT